MDGITREELSNVRAVLADREPTVRGALRALATQGLGMQVVGEADDDAALQLQVQALRPDLVIVAWSLVGAHAEAALAALRRSSEGLRIVVLGLRPETRREALGAGADAYISMVDAPDVVARVLQTCPRRASGEKTNEPGGTS